MAVAEKSNPARASSSPGPKGLGQSHCCNPRVSSICQDTYPQDLNNVLHIYRNSSISPVNLYMFNLK
jgi:hypothetical protein